MMWIRGVVRYAAVGAVLGGLITSSEVSRAEEASAAAGGCWFGITADRLEEGWRERENYWGKGVLVTHVSPGGPADRIGMARGDVVVSIGSSLLKTPNDLNTLEAKLEPGQPVSVVVARNGGKLIKILNIEPSLPPGAKAAEVTASEAAPVIIAETAIEEPAPEVVPEAAVEIAPEVQAEKAPEAQAEKAAGSVVSGSAETPVPGMAAAAGAGAVAAKGKEEEDPFGARCQTMNADLGAALGSPDGRGALIVDVRAGSIAGVAGFKAGDIITKVGDREVADADQLGPAVQDRSGIVPVEALRQGTARTVQVNFGGDPPTQPAAKEDPELAKLREEIRQLQAEIQKLKAEVDQLKKL